MSYDIRIRVKAEGADVYPVVGVPEYDSPTYNLGELFRKCMDWDYSQSDDNGNTCYYKCAEVLPKVEHGILELHTNRKNYEKYLPDNGWGTMSGAIKSLQSLRDCIYEKAEEIPLECLYMTW